LAPRTFTIVAAGGLIGVALGLSSTELALSVWFVVIEKAGIRVVEKYKEALQEHRFRR